MDVKIALFRGINVGGRNRLPMNSLVTILEQLDCTNVKTYIQSGNAVFEAPNLALSDLEREVRLAVKNAHGFEPAVLLLSAEKFIAARRANPYPEAEAEPKSLHLFFLSTAAVAVDENRIVELQSAAERYQLIDNVFYLHAPDGIGRSKLAANVERCLGVPATARNWRTVTKIEALLNS